MSINAIQSGIRSENLVPAKPFEGGCLASVAKKVKSAVSNVFEKMGSVIDLSFLEILVGVFLINYCFPSQSALAALTTAALVGVGMGSVNLAAQKFYQRIGG